MVKLRIFAGLTIPENAAALNLGRRTVDRQWAYASAWLRTGQAGRAVKAGRSEFFPEFFDFWPRIRALIYRGLVRRAAR